MKTKRPSKRAVKSPIKRALAIRDEWLCGYAAAVAAFIRLYDQVSAARYVLSGDGLTVAKLKRAGVGMFDLSQLRKTLR